MYDMNELGYIKQENIPMHKKFVKNLVSYVLHACIIAYITLFFFWQGV